MAARLITVFGGADFIGKSLISHLVKTGARIRTAVLNPNESMEILPLGDVGQIQLVQANLKNEASVRAAVKGSDIVINLSSVSLDAGKAKFNQIYDLGAELVAKISAEYGVSKLIHLSDIIADSSEEACSYARARAAGDEKIRASFPAATILRTSVIFGQGDDLFTPIAKIIKVYPVTPLFRGCTKLQPIFVGDVAKAISCAVTESKYAGQTYELGGAEIYTVQELYEKTMAETSQETMLFPVPEFIAPMKAWGMGFLPNAPMTLGKYQALGVDSCVNKKSKSLKDFGIKPVSVDSILPLYMEAYRPRGQFQKLA